MSYLVKYFLLVMIIMVVSCTEDDVPVAVDPAPTIRLVKVADKWNPRAQEKYKIEVTIDDPQGPDNIQSVTVDIRRDTEGPVINTDSLYDDGAFYNKENGDVLARDGIFSNRLSPQDLSSPVQAGLYYLRFIAQDKDNHETVSDDYIIGISENRSPVISDVSAPDSFSVFSFESVMQVTASDSDGISDIQSVYYRSQKVGSEQIRYEGELYDDGDPASGDQVAGDGIFSTRLDTAFLTAKKGDYTLYFYARDSFDDENEIVPEHIMRVSNYSPEITSVAIPDSMIIPSIGSYRYASMEATVTNPEGLADIDSVYFFSFRDGNPLFNGSPVILQDNGIPFDYENYVNELNQSRRVISAGDAVAGDGIFTFPLVIESNFTAGDYLFRLYVADKAQNVYGPLDVTLRVVRWVL
jgi:hypothetical protein